MPDDRDATQSQADDTVVRRRLPISSTPCTGSWNYEKLQAFVRQISEKIKQEN